MSDLDLDKETTVIRQLYFLMRPFDQYAQERIFAYAGHLLRHEASREKQEQWAKQQQS